MNIFYHKPPELMVETNRTVCGADFPYTEKFPIALIEYKFYNNAQEMLIKRRQGIG